MGGRVSISFTPVIAPADHLPRGIHKNCPDRDVIADQGTTSLIKGQAHEGFVVAVAGAVAKDSGHGHRLSYEKVVLMGNSKGIR